MHFTGVNKKATRGWLGRRDVIEILPPSTKGGQITIDGYLVPRIEVSEDAATGQWHVIYDGRFGVVAESLEELQRWLWIVANAQAVGEGYSCHGENSVYRPNPHQVAVRQIGSVNQVTGTQEG